MYVAKPCSMYGFEKFFYYYSFFYLLFFFNEQKWIQLSNWMSTVPLKNKKSTYGKYATLYISRDKYLFNLLDFYYI